MGDRHAGNWSREGFNNLFGEAEAVSRVAEDEACSGDKEVGLVAVCERRQCCGGRQANAEKVVAGKPRRRGDVNIWFSQTT